MIEVDRKTFKTALGVLLGTIGRNNKIYALDCAVLDTRQDRLTMRATNLDNHLTLYLPAEGAWGWQALADLRTLKSLAGLETGPVRLDFCDGKVCLDSAVLDGGFEIADFPLEPPLAGETQPWPADALREALEFVIPAVCKDEIRYYLRGVYFQVYKGGDGKMRLVATDGHVMKMIDTALPGGPEECPPFIMHEKTVKVLLKSMAFVKPETLLFSRGKGHVHISGMGRETSFSLSAKPIDGSFPDYLRVIPSPKETEYSFTFDAGEMLAMLARLPKVPPMAPKPVEFDMFNRLARFEPEGAAAIELPLPIRDYVSPGDLREKATTGFNPRVLQAALSGYTGEMRMRFEEALSPAVIRSAGDNSRLSVTMPMRL